MKFALFYVEKVNFDYEYNRFIESKLIQSICTVFRSHFGLSMPQIVKHHKKFLPQKQLIERVKFILVARSYQEFF